MLTEFLASVIVITIVIGWGILLLYMAIDAIKQKEYVISLAFFVLGVFFLALSISVIFEILIPSVLG